MTTTLKSNIKNFNIYSWSIVISFVCAILAMRSGTNGISYIDFLQTSPLIILAVICSEKLAPLVNQPDANLRNSQLFKRDLFVLSLSFLLGCLISLVFSYNNSDAKGWWPLIIFFTTIYGVLFSIFFSIIAILIKNHKQYTLLFALIIFTLVLMANFFPHYTFIPFLGNIETFYVIIGSLLIFHCLFAVICKIMRVLQWKKKNHQDLR